MKFFTSLVLLGNIVIFSSLSKRLLNSFGISISLLIALFTALSNFAGCAQTKDTHASLSFLSNNTFSPVAVCGSAI